MRPFLFATLVLSVLCLPQFAQTTEGAAAAPKTLSQHDRDFLMSNLQASRKEFLDSVAGLTPEQWNFKAAPERWSIAECAEHIAVSDDFISGIVRDQVMKGPAKARAGQGKGRGHTQIRGGPFAEVQSS